MFSLNFSIIMSSAILTELYAALTCLKKYQDQQGGLLKLKILEDIQMMDADLITAILKRQQLKKHFTATIADITVLDKQKLQTFFNSREFLPDSYTAFKNKIGLTRGGAYLSDSAKVVLDFPYKDAYLVGGQSAEDVSREEKFYNAVLAPEHVDTLLQDKVFINWEKYDAQGKHAVASVSDTDNLILKGNNLLVLHSLVKRYASKVKLVYIDPPYNTGKDGFKYNDKFNHSTWLTFMRNRLELGRTVLTDDGLIMVQCDDNEQAYLKVLMDEIYGRDNYITTFVWEKTQHFGRQKLNYYSNAEFIHVYAKTLMNGTIGLKRLLVEAEQNEFEDAPLYNAGNNIQTLTVPKNQCKFNIPDGIYTTGTDDKFELLSPVSVLAGVNTNEFKIQFKSRWTDTKLQECFKSNGVMLIKSMAFSPRVIYGDRDASIVSPKQIIFTNKNQGVVAEWGNIKVGTTSEGSAELTQLFGVDKFSFPKPESLIAYLIGIATKPKDLVVDFHIGSGTTAAVAHKMERQYIGIEQMDYIETITRERMKKVIAGEQGGISKDIGWKGGGSFVYAELYDISKILLDKISAVKTDSTLKEVEKDILAYEVYLDINFDAKILQLREYKDLALKDKKRFLMDSIDKNTLYLNYSEMEDSTYKVRQQDRDVNNQFYRETRSNK